MNEISAICEFGNLKINRRYANAARERFKNILPVYGNPIRRQTFSKIRLVRFAS